MGSEIIGYIAFEEALKESGQQPPALGREEAVLLHRDIVAILERLERRRIGGGAANAQFLHLLDQARFGIAGRRLGEMLLGMDCFLGRRIALAQARQAAAFLILIVVPAFLVQRGEAGEEHDMARSAERSAHGTVCHFARSEEHTSELQSLMRSSYAAF